MMIVRSIVGALAGAGFGFLFYRLVGCRTGACPLTANPYLAMAVWASIGALLAAAK